eukprot:4505413-Alexandrium_andersonii.AAC.1
MMPCAQSGVACCCPPVVLPLIVRHASHICMNAFEAGQTQWMLTTQAKGPTAPATPARAGAMRATMRTAVVECWATLLMLAQMPTPRLWTHPWAR